MTPRWKAPEQWKSWSDREGLILDHRGPFDIESQTPPRLVKLVDDPGRGVMLDGRDGPGEKPASIPPRLLERFMLLAEASEHRIAHFAERYGMLSLCVHGNPFYRCTRQRKSKFLLCFPTFYEPVAVWRTWARRLGSLFAICARVHGSERISDDEFASLFGQKDGEGFRRLIRSLELEEAIKVPWRNRQSFKRTCVAILINRLLWIGDVRPSFAWAADSPQVTWTGGGLLGSLATQFAFAGGRIDQFAMCSGCGVAFVPERRRTRGKHRWCKNPKCKRASQAYASRRYRSGDSKT